MVKSPQTLGWATVQGPVLESAKEQRPNKIAIVKNEAKLAIKFVRI